MRSLTDVQKVNYNCWEAADKQTETTACSPLCLRGATDLEGIFQEVSLNGSNLEPDRAKKDGSWRLRPWLEKHSFNVFVRKVSPWHSVEHRILQEHKVSPCSGWC